MDDSLTNELACVAMISMRIGIVRDQLRRHRSFTRTVGSDFETLYRNVSTPVRIAALEWYQYSLLNDPLLNQKWDEFIDDVAQELIDTYCTSTIGKFVATFTIKGSLREMIRADINSRIREMLET